MNKLDVLKENFELKQENEKLKKQLLTQENYKNAFYNVINEIYNVYWYHFDNMVHVSDIVAIIKKHLPKMYK